MMTKHPPTETLLAEVLNYIEQAEQLLLTGDIDALHALDNKVDELAAQLKKLPIEETRHYDDAIHLLAGRASELTHAMQETQKEIAEKLESVTSHHKAAKAYLKAPGA